MKKKKFNAKKSLPLGVTISERVLSERTLLEQQRAKKRKIFWLLRPFFQGPGYFVFFLAISYAFYTYAIEKKREDTFQLQNQIQTLRLQRNQLQEYKEELQLQMHSQTDAAWVELLLKKHFGFVPEGQRKVVFYETNDER